MSGIELLVQLALFLPDTKTRQRNTFTALVEGVLSKKFAKKQCFTIKSLDLILHRHHSENLRLLQMET